MTATYLYCVVRAARKPPVARVAPGVPGASRPAILPLSRTLWLVVADVPLDVYGAAALEAHLTDLEWVGRVAMAHEAVVESFTRRASTTVVPMKLFTMFSSGERAAEELTAKKPAIDSAMRRIAGAEEWGVRILGGGGAVSRQTSTPVASGTAFLAAKRRARDEVRDARIAAAEAARQAYDRLAKLAKDARLREDAPPAGAVQPLVDAAFLVPGTRRARFTQLARREAEACARAGARMTLTGPWPAYHFVGDGADSPR